MVNRIKSATHHAEPVMFVRLGTALPGQPCRARWCDHALTVRATLADRPRDQQQEQEDAERQNSKCPGRDRQLYMRRLGLEERQSQGHTRSVAAGSVWWVTQLERATKPAPSRLALVRATA
jgi:hypothetical protein